MTVRPSIEVFLPFFFSSPYSLNLRDHQLDVPGKERPAVSHHAEHNTMGRFLAVLAVLTWAYGLSPGYTMAASPGSLTTVSQVLSAPATETGGLSPAIPPSTNPTEALQHTTDPDCDDKAPSNRSAKTLLSRIVRSPAPKRDAQCPIPSTPDNLSQEEPPQ